MKLKLISGIYKKVEYPTHTAHEGYGIFTENNNPVAFLSWIATPDANKPTNILMHVDKNIKSADYIPRLYDVKPMPTLGHGISKIKQLYAELTNAN